MKYIYLLSILMLFFCGFVATDSVIAESSFTDQNYPYITISTKGDNAGEIIDTNIKEPTLLSDAQQKCSLDPNKKIMSGSYYHPNKKHAIAIYTNGNGSGASAIKNGNEWASYSHSTNNSTESTCQFRTY